MTGSFNVPGDRAFEVNPRYNQQPWPKGRPTNEVPREFFDVATRRRVTAMTRWLDRRAVVEAAEALLRTDAARRERRAAAQAEGWEAGEPGE